MEVWGSSPHEPTIHCRFRKQVAEFREDGGSSFCSVVGSTAFLPPLQDAACSESFKFPLKARWRSL